MRPVRPPLRERLTWNTLGLMSTDAREHRAAMARGAVYLYAAGAMLAFVSMVLPGTNDRHLAALLGIAAGALALGGLHLLAFDRLPVWVFQASGVAATGLVTTAVLATASVSRRTTWAR